MNWIPIEEQIPDNGENEVFCLVTCQEWDNFTGELSTPHIKILSYLPKVGIWNIKSPIKVTAWMPLPEIYESKDWSN